MSRRWRADDADEHALRDEMLRICDRRVPIDMRTAMSLVFFHDHHDEGDEDVQRGDEDDHADGDVGDEALHVEAVEELCFALSSWWS